MEFGICILSIVPVRSQPKETSEMVSQLLFGELLVKLEEYKSWHRVRLIHDNYEGWIDKKQYLHLNEHEFQQINNEIPGTTIDLVQILNNVTSNTIFPVILGSTLPGYQDGKFSILESQYEYDGSISEQGISRDLIAEYAYLYLLAPYCWGGRSPFGIDCSGLVQMVYKLAGVALLRDASQQATQGETVNFVSEANTGDIAFFDNEEEEINHVGIILPNNRIIHASGRVRIDDFDHQGIYNHELKRYTHNLRLVKSLL